MGGRRQTYVQKFCLAKRDWQLYEVDSQSVPEMFCGPFFGWKQLYEERKGSRFRDLFGKFLTHSKVQGMKENFSWKSLIIVVTDGVRTMVMEGNHRCIALTQMLREQMEIRERLLVAVSFYAAEEYDLFERIFQQGYTEDFQCQS